VQQQGDSNPAAPSTHKRTAGGSDRTEHVELDIRSLQDQATGSLRTSYEGVQRGLPCEAAEAAAGHFKQHGTATAQPELLHNLMALAVSSGSNECVEAVAQALLQQRFRPASVLLHLPGALEALRGTPRHQRLFLQLLSSMPLLDLGEVEVARGRVQQGQQACRWGQAAR
jgi:hypothetical protein